MLATVTRIDSKRPTKAVSFEVDFAEFIGGLQNEAREWAHKLGFRGSDFKQLQRQVEDEIHWWNETKGLDFYESSFFNQPHKKSRRKVSPNWRRLLALHGISVALDPRSQEGAGSTVEAWVDLMEDYVPLMRRHAPTLPPGPAREEMRHHSSNLRARERVKELESQAAKKINDIREKLEVEMKHVLHE
jgi:hypothetical protein